MAYKERELTEREHFLALKIRELIPRAERLSFVQDFCDMVEEHRDRANEAIVALDPHKHLPGVPVQSEVWKALHFPRYRFFDVALPGTGWASMLTLDQAKKLRHRETLIDTQGKRWYVNGVAMATDRAEATDPRTWTLPSVCHPR